MGVRVDRVEAQVERHVPPLDLAVELGLDAHEELPASAAAGGEAGRDHLLTRMADEVLRREGLAHLRHLRNVPLEARPLLERRAHAVHGVAPRLADGADAPELWAPAARLDRVEREHVREDVAVGEERGRCGSSCEDARAVAQPGGRRAGGDGARTSIWSLGDGEVLRSRTPADRRLRRW